MQVLKRLRGDVPLPWEEGLSAEAHKQLGLLKGPVLGLLQRDTASRGNVKDFHQACMQMFASHGAPSVVA